MRESITIDLYFSSTVNEPTGVANLGLPNDVGIWRMITPSMLTVKVWAEIFPTPSTVAPVPKLRRVPPASNVIRECAGQN